MSHKNVFVYLIGFAGVGKLTTAHQLGKSLNARIVDNHWINNPIFGLLNNDNVTPFPAAVWDEVAKVRSAVLESIASFSPAQDNFILTNALAEKDAEDRKIYEAVLEVAERRKALFVPVTLICNEEELRRRVVSPDREKLCKRMDPDAATREVRTLSPLVTDHPHRRTLDTSTLSPETSAKMILDHIDSLTLRLAMK